VATSCVGAAPAQKEMVENISVDKELHGFNRNEEEPLLSSTSSPELVSAFTLKAEAP
jgi:hypothetical protein